MAAEGITTCPAYVLPEVATVDEVRFNQIHNASDLELSDAIISVGARPVGWGVIEPKSIKITKPPNRAAQLNEVLRLLSRYGEWGNAVVDRSGTVLVGHLYAKGCSLLGIPLRVYAVENNLRSCVFSSFGRQYGRFSYAHLPKTTWVQSLAQPFRLSRSGGKQYHSHLYEDHLIPWLHEGVRVLDFGAGRMDYVSRLSGRGVNIRGIEFFHRRRGSLNLDYAAIHKHIDLLCETLARDGLFDAVICDSVLNSVDSPQAEKDVMACISGLCRPRGMLFFSARSRETIDGQFAARASAKDSDERGVQFIDDRGFSAMFQRGVWLYQRFFTLEEMTALAKRYLGPEFKGPLNGPPWIVYGRKTAVLPHAEVESAIDREFNLPWPGGKSVGRSNDVLKAYRIAIAKGK